MNCWSTKLAAFAGIAAIAISSLATAADSAYPERPVQVISPYAAGGANDLLTRLMAKSLAEQFSASFIAENKAGANGIVGSTYVARSTPDGYVLLMGNSATHGTNPSLYPDTPYDPISDFAAVGMVGAVPIVLVVNSELGIDNIKELLEYGKANPKKLSFGSSGVGGTGHLAGEAFKAATGLDIVHVPYKGDGPAVTDTMGGQVSMSFVGVAAAAKQLASNKIKILAVAHPSRLKTLPEIPTLTESGIHDVEFMQWYALLAKSGTPDHVVMKLNQAIKKIQEKPEVRQTMASLGVEQIYMTPKELSSFIDNEISRFGEIIQKLHINK